jgi:hypothetical protein
MTRQCEEEKRSSCQQVLPFKLSSFTLSFLRDSRMPSTSCSTASAAGRLPHSHSLHRSQHRRSLQLPSSSLLIQTGRVLLQRASFDGCSSGRRRPSRLGGFACCCCCWRSPGIQTLEGKRREMVVVWDEREAQGTKRIERLCRNLHDHRPVQPVCGKCLTRAGKLARLW